MESYSYLKISALWQKKLWQNVLTSTEHDLKMFVPTFLFEKGGKRSESENYFEFII